MSGQGSVLNSYKGAVTDIDETAIGRTMLSFARDVVFQPNNKNVGAPDPDVSAIIGVLRFLSTTKISVCGDPLF